jgi:hypothetical protein
MSWFRIDKERRGEDPFLLWKVRIFAVGATLGLAGIFMNQRILVWAAIVVLVVGLVLRMASRRPAPPTED